KHDSIPALRALIGALPPDTKSNIKNTLNDGVDHLNDLVSQECNARQNTTETQPSTTSTQTTQSTTTETTPTTNTEPKPNTNTNTNTNTTTTPPPCRC